MKVKGNVFKNKRVLMEYIFKAKAEKLRVKTLEDQAAAHRQRNKAARARKIAKTVQGSRVDAVAETGPVEVKKSEQQKPLTKAAKREQQAAKAAAPKPVVAAKPVAKAATPAAKPAAKPAASKPAAAKPAAAKPAATKPAAKPAAAKPATKK